MYFFRIVSALKYFYNDNAKIMFCEIVISRGNQPRLPPHLDTDSNPQTVWQKGICVEAPVSGQFHLFLCLEILIRISTKNGETCSLK